MAKDGFSVTLKGGKELEQKLARIGPEGLKTAAVSLKDSGDNIMSISQDQFCPVMTGTLKSTGYVNEPEIHGSSVEVTLGYGGPAAKYALKVHENPRSGATGGVSPSGAKYKRWAKVGQWKYLETPLKENAKNVVSDLKLAVDEMFQRMKG